MDLYAIDTAHGQRYVTPDDSDSRALATLTGTRSATSDQLRALRALGVCIRLVPNPSLAAASLFPLDIPQHPYMQGTRT